MKQHRLKWKLLTLAGGYGAVLLWFFISLYHDQIVDGQRYLEASIAGTMTAETVQAARGIVTDRNGKVLIGNRLAYTLSFDGTVFGENDGDRNAAIARLLALLEDEGLSWHDALPISEDPPWDYLPSAGEDETFDAFLSDRKLTGRAAPAVMARLYDEFGIDPALDRKTARKIAGVRYGLERQDVCLLCDDVPAPLIGQITDGRFAGVTVGTASARVYHTACAAHVLGRVSRIYAEDWQKYRELGYSMDALVGAGGVEEAFEAYLHGTNGTRLITTDAATGKITGELYTVAPQPGKTVSLTLDIDLQSATENALAQTIESMTDDDSQPRGGAAAVVAVGSGEVLALASYPTYDLSRFNEGYEQLLEDPRLPMFNRATDGLYAPGSTFKPCTAVAALESGVITPDMTVRDQGIYTYYDYPQPMCWIYQSSGETHGLLNVSRAITESCNYFFYEVGRRTGIETLADYAAQFGLGQHTGIEIGDSAGVIASPDYARENGLDWTEGQTVTAAIGQSYHLFTPLQLANYIATLVSGGRHYDAHLLKDVKSYDNAAVQYTYRKPPRNVVSMSESTRAAVLAGMRDLTESGSVAPQFSECVVSAGAKTGTAQVGEELNNGVFVAFAPYEDPKIAVAVVIEKGGSGAALASTAVAIINACFAGDPQVSP
ncbi:MAG: penicillin-binding protein A [Oscillospiraceae bacterium]|nr:penicillin-binding protein A [Oscillospiraceae bacterium]